MQTADTFLPQDASPQDWRNAFGLMQVQIKDLERSAGKPGEVDAVARQLANLESAFADFSRAYTKDVEEINEKLETLSSIVARIIPEVKEPEDAE